MSSTISLRLAFFGFAVLIAMRDVAAEVLRESPESMALLICAVIATLAGAATAVSGSASSLLGKLRRPPVRYRVVALSAMTAVIYWVTFEMIGRLGAGDFALIDYGLAPILTAGIGFLFFAGEQPGMRVAVAMLLYLVGLWLMMGHQPHSNLLLLAVAILSPLCTAVSDALTKWLLTNGRLERSELLFVRFAPACLVLAVVASRAPGGPHINNWGWSLLVAAFMGFLPLWLLCTGLGRAALNRYAVWECLIPALAFLATLPFHPEHQTVIAATGAGLIIGAVIINESGVAPTMAGRMKTPPQVVGG